MQHILLYVVKDSFSIFKTPPFLLRVGDVSFRFLALCEITFVIE